MKRLLQHLKAFATAKWSLDTFSLYLICSTFYFLVMLLSDLPRGRWALASLDALCVAVGAFWIARNIDVKVTKKLLE